MFIAVSQKITTKTCDVNRYGLFQHSNAFRELRPKSFCVMQEFKTRLHYYHWFHVIIDLKQIDILDCLVFNDETRFHLRAYVSSQNSRVWNYGNSHVGN